MFSESNFLIIFFACILVAAALYDLRFQKIPNILTFPSILIALVYNCATGGFEGLLLSIAGLALGVALLIVPYLIGGMGAGDVKLLGAVGAVLGPKAVFNAFLLTAIIGGIYSILLLLFQYKYSKSLLVRYATMFKTFTFTRQFIYIPATTNQDKPKLCYGIAIALGALWTIWWQVSNHGFLI